MESREIEDDLVRLFQKGYSDGLTDEQMKTIALYKAHESRNWNLTAVLALTAAVACSLVAVRNSSINPASLSDAQCLIDLDGALPELFRPIANCSMCEGLDGAPIRSKMSKEEFLANHAYSGRPVLIRNETDSWTAFETFNFSYFKKVFQQKKNKDNDERDESDQFFPYKTNFVNLQHFLKMSKRREKKLKWYVGWSNSRKDIMTELRKHYRRPSFLPDESESSQVDWIFMGGTGRGAMIHIDFVSRPSWQAQIKGRKTWSLFPPPECDHICKPFNITMNKGDIVVVDTNVWYHSTFIHDGEMSITIGSEYD